MQPEIVNKLYDEEVAVKRVIHADDNIGRIESLLSQSRNLTWNQAARMTLERLLDFKYKVAVFKPQG